MREPRKHAKEPFPTVRNGENGRDQGGRFSKGNRAAAGHGGPKTSADLREAFAGAVTPADVRQIARTLVKRAKEGDVAAIRELLNRTIGKPEATIQPTTETPSSPAGTGGLPPVNLEKMLEQEKRRFHRNSGWPPVEPQD